MDGSPQLPNFDNVFTHGKFKLHILAYRKITKEEALQAVGAYALSKHIKELPLTGEDTYGTFIGINE